MGSHDGWQLRIFHVTLSPVTRSTASRCSLSDGPPPGGTVTQCEGPRIRVGVILLLVVLGLCCGCGPSTDGAAAAEPPTINQLSAESSGRVPSAIPGLVGLSPFIHAASEDPEKLTTKTCINRWNSGFPDKSRGWIQRIQHKRLTVTAYEDHISVIGSAEAKTFASCGYAFVAGPHTLALVVAPPQGSTASWQGKVFYYKTASAISSVSAASNAVVGGSGRLTMAA